MTVSLDLSMTVLHCRLIWIIQNNFTVFFNPGNVGVLVLDRDRGEMITFDYFGSDVEVVYTFDQRAGTDMLFDQFSGSGNVILCDFT